MHFDPTLNAHDVVLPIGLLLLLCAFVLFLLQFMQYPKPVGWDKPMLAWTLLTLWLILTAYGSAGTLTLVLVVVLLALLIVVLFTRNRRQP